MLWFVYIGLLKDGRFYVGMTKRHLDERAHRHQTGWGGTFTKGVKLGSDALVRATSKAQPFSFPISAVLAF